MGLTPLPRAPLLLGEEAWPGLDGEGHNTAKGPSGRGCVWLASCRWRVRICYGLMRTRPDVLWAPTADPAALRLPQGASARAGTVFPGVLGCGWFVINPICSLLLNRPSSEAPTAYHLRRGIFYNNDIYLEQAFEARATSKEDLPPGKLALEKGHWEERGTSPHPRPHSVAKGTWLPVATTFLPLQEAWRGAA